MLEYCVLKKSYLINRSPLNSSQYFVVQHIFYGALQLYGILANFDSEFERVINTVAMSKMYRCNLNYKILTTQFVCCHLKRVALL